MAWSCAKSSIARLIWLAMMAPSSAAHAPVDGVVQRGGEGGGFPRAVKNRRRRVGGVGGPARADRGVVAMAERNIRHAAAADFACITEHAGPAVGLQEVSEP